MKAIGYRQSLPVTDANALENITLPVPEASGHDLAHTMLESQQAHGKIVLEGF